MFSGGNPNAASHRREEFSLSDAQSLWDSARQTNHKSLLRPHTSKDTPHTFPSCNRQWHKTKKKHYIFAVVVPSLGHHHYSEHFCYEYESMIEKKALPTQLWTFAANTCHGDQLCLTWHHENCDNDQEQTDKMTHMYVYTLTHSNV